MRPITQSLSWLLALLVLVASPAPANVDEDTNWKPLVVLTFAQDNKKETTFGHVSTRYTIYPSGFAMIEQDVFGQGPGNSIHSAWLSDFRMDTVVKLVGSISSTRGIAKQPVNNIIMEGSATGNSKVVRAIPPNIEDIESMLRMIGGLWPALEPQLPKPVVASR